MKERKSSWDTLLLLLLRFCECGWGFNFGCYIQKRRYLYFFFSLWDNVPLLRWTGWERWEHTTLTSGEWFFKFNLEYLLGSRNAQKSIKTPAICNGWPCRSIWILCFPPRFWIFYPFWKFGWRCYLVGRGFVIYF